MTHALVISFSLRFSDQQLAMVKSKHQALRAFLLEELEVIPALSFSWKISVWWEPSYLTSQNVLIIGLMYLC